MRANSSGAAVIPIAILASLACLCPTAGSAAAAARLGDSDPVEYLGDQPELIYSSSQSFGELGQNVAAHERGKAGAPLQVGTQTYTQGLGHHANGTISVLLEGQYAAFDAEVGLQPCGVEGSVIFRVFVDGEQRFDSGVMRGTNAAKPVHVDLAKAEELKLEANDSGDGINCDMANWLNARLTRAAGVARRAPETAVNIAPSGRVVTWDPRRLDGSRADRIQEFHTEDLFLESAVPANADGSYAVPVSPDGQGCIGLQWLNRRALRELALEFPTPTLMPTAKDVQVQGWFGESAWQGGWKPLAGEVQVSGNSLVFRLSPKAGVVQTQKVRWIFPAAGKVLVSHLYAFTRSRWHNVKLVVEAEKPAKGARGELSVQNGELVGEEPAAQSAPGQVVKLKLTRPLHLTVRSSRPSSFKSDPTALLFRFPAGAFAVAVEDVLTNGCVYLPDYGVFVSRDPAPLTLAQYKQSIAGRKTILQQVREMPDQTLEQAMGRTHHQAQREGPVMLSLACDNAKFVVGRDGSLQFQTVTNVTTDWFATAGAVRPIFGSGPPGEFTRSLDGGWLPIPLITTEKQGVRYCQRTFVAPCDEAGSDPARLNRRSICVAEFTVTNTLAQPAEAAVTLDFLADAPHKKPATLSAVPDGFVASAEGRSLALISMDAVEPLKASADGNLFKLRGNLAAHAGASFVVMLPAQRMDFSVSPWPAHLRADTEAYWKAVLAPAMQVETPAPLLNDVIRSSQVRCLIAARNEADGQRVAAWIAAMSYGPLESEANSVIRGMVFMGHRDFARRSLDFFIHRYNKSGFLTTGYTTFGTAWHLWTLGEHYQLYRESDWLRGVAPEVERVADWIVRQTDKTKKPGAPEYGLMPPGVMADWNSFAFHYALNAYYYAALREVAAALADLPQSRPGVSPGSSSGKGRRNACPTFTRAADDLRANILRAYRWTQAQAPALPLRNGTWVPHYPSQVHSPGKLADFFPGQDGGRSWCYDVEIGAHQLVPTGVFAPHDREVDRIMDHMEDVQFLSDGWFDYPASMNEQDWFDLGGFSKVQPYYCRNCEIDALRDDVKPFVRSYFNTIAAMLNPEVLTLWEHFHHSGAWDKTHETGYFLHQTRTMLVTERGDQLWLAPFITSNWLKDGQKLSVKDAPTRFGPVSYQIESRLTGGQIHATINPPTRQPPKEIVLRLRNPEGAPIRSVRVNGKRHSDFDKADGLVRLKPSREALELEVLYR